VRDGRPNLAQARRGDLTRTRGCSGGQGTAMVPKNDESTASSAADLPDVVPEQPVKRDKLQGAWPQLSNATAALSLHVCPLLALGVAFQACLLGIPNSWLGVDFRVHNVVAF